MGLRSYPFYIVDHVFAGSDMELCISDDLFEEYYEVLNNMASVTAYTGIVTTYSAIVSYNMAIVTTYIANVRTYNGTVTTYNGHVSPYTGMYLI